MCQDVMLNDCHSRRSAFLLWEGCSRTCPVICKCSLRCFCFLAESPCNFVATVFVHLPKQPPPPPLSPSHLENCCITPRQALTGANRARSGYILRATLLYIATCTRFQLCRFESTWLVCVFVFLFLADLWNNFFFQLPRMCEEEEKKKVALHSLLPRFMWVCVCVCARMWECVSIVWCALKRAASRTCKQRKKCGLVCAGVWNKATRLLYKKLTL